MRNGFDRWPALILVLGLFVPGDAVALRCGGDLVSEGDTAYEVREICGQPDYIQPLHGPGYGGEALWYYNFGPSDLIRELRIRDGRVARIRTPGRGFRERPGPGACGPMDIRTGMTGYELRVRCGEPVQREAKHLLRPVWRHEILVGHRRVWIEDWYYTFGDRRLDRRVRLVDGRVEAVDTVD